MARAGLLLWMSVVAQGQPNATSLEFKVKAAYLFNFAKYVEWPSQAFAGPDSPIVIGVLGEDPFRDVLERTVENRKISNRTVVTKRALAIENLKDCHVLFISNSEKQRLPQVLNKKAAPFALTVSDTDRFLQGGGMVHFLIDESSVRFEINLERAEEAGLKIGSRMLSSAKSVYSERSKPAP